MSSPPTEEELDLLCVKFLLVLPPEELATHRIWVHLAKACYYFWDHLHPGAQPYSRELLAQQLNRKLDYPHSESTLKEISTLSHRVPLCGVIVTNEDHSEVLLVEGRNQQAKPGRSRQKNALTFPKGKRNQNESELECAQRELREEVGLSLELRPEAVCVCVDGRPHRFNQRHTYFAAQVPKSLVDTDALNERLQSQGANLEIQRVLWCPLKGMNQSTLSFVTKDALQRYEARLPKPKPNPLLTFRLKVENYG